MARHIVLGNGNILVCLDDHSRIRDFYYPHVGQENHVAGKMHKFGIWIDGNFSWFDSDEWQRKLGYKKDALMSDIVGINRKINIKINICDTVHFLHDVYLKKVVIKNLTDKKRETKLFFHQRFEISESNVGDTAYYHPEVDSIIHYKGKRYFLINGQFRNRRNHGISSYTTGLAGEYGREGTFRDAEDGYLSGNPIEHGSVDSTVSFDFCLKPEQEREIYYWVCVGKNYDDVSKLNLLVLQKKPKNLFREIEKFWVKWVNRTPFHFFGLSQKVVDLFKKSLLIIRAHVDNGGAIIPSGDSEMLFLKRDTYTYMWPRDGALIARSLDRAGYTDITKNFFKFCHQSLAKGGYLLHKYRPDGSLGSSWHPWIKDLHVQLPIQEDETALVLDALWKHFTQHAQTEHVMRIFDTFIRRTANFLVKYRDKKTGLPLESYDLWEEKLGVHTFTCAAVYAGLRAAAHFEEVLGTENKQRKYEKAAREVRKGILNYLYDKEEERFIKGIYYDGNEIKKDMTNDASSAYGVFQFKVLPADDRRVKSSFEYFKNRLICNTPIGGYARYEGDMYHRVTDDVPGNPWFVTTLWLAEYYIAIAKNEKELKPAVDIFDWVTNRALETGILAEQIHPYTGEPLSVAPLTWSHAGFIIAINKYLEKLDKLGICQMCNPPKFMEKKLGVHKNHNTKK